MATPLRIVFIHLVVGVLIGVGLFIVKRQWEQTTDVVYASAIGILVATAYVTSYRAYAAGLKEGLAALRTAGHDLHGLASQGALTLAKAGLKSEAVRLYQ